MNIDKSHNDDLGVLLPPVGLEKLATRLYRITGFVTTLCTESDLRPLVFSRYYHIRRVAWTAALLAQLRNAFNNSVNHDKVVWLSWAHDLNRWPFAHNAEKGLFDQAKDIPRYFNKSGKNLPSDILSDLEGIISKTYANLSEEGRVVLLADMITGFIEDPLWAIIALDLSPDFIPPNIANYLCIKIDLPEIQKRLLELNYAFAETRAIEPFRTKFDTFFKDTITNFVMTREFANTLPLGDPKFESWRRLVKEDLMIKKIFTYNNEKVSHGSRLKSELIVPLCNTLGSDAIAVLTTIDEPGVLELAKELGLLKKQNISDYLPSLNYVTEHEPNLSFRRNSQTQHTHGSFI
ncbi:MAG: hypothetical protein JXJ17_18580 [Anaerolineae bacterium]|nr:hypothetical protein [Anaerolineae bacterium]